MPIMCLRASEISHPRFFDLALKYLHLSLLDLAPAKTNSQPICRAAALHRRIWTFPFSTDRSVPQPRGRLRSVPGRSFPLPFTTAGPSSELAMAKLIFDPSMQSALGLFDVALLDTSATERGALDPQGIFVIERANEAVLRYIRAGSAPATCLRAPL